MISTSVNGTSAVNTTAVNAPTITATAISVSDVSNNVTAVIATNVGAAGGKGAGKSRSAVNEVPRNQTSVAASTSKEKLLKATRNKNLYVPRDVFMKGIQDRGVKDKSSPAHILRFPSLKKVAQLISKVLKKEKFDPFVNLFNVT